MSSLNVLRKPRFVWSALVPGGGGTLGGAVSVSDGIAQAANTARFLLNNDAGRSHVVCVVEIVCDTCNGNGTVKHGKRSVRKCPDCKGNTSPISGPTAIRFRVNQAGGFATDDGKPCDCAPEHREGPPGGVCQRCARWVIS